jgi:hypothetical protein
MAKVTLNFTACVSSATNLLQAAFCVSVSPPIPLSFQARVTQVDRIPKRDALLPLAD